jgi:Ran GTPase-activating protein (RanGAP) involved in mRNA processing and transport
MSASLSPPLLSGRNNYFRIERGLSEIEHIVIATILTHSTAVTGVQLDLYVSDYSAKAAEAMGEYIRSSIQLHRVHLYLSWNESFEELPTRALSILLRALQDSTSVIEIRLLGFEAWSRLGFYGFWGTSPELAFKRDVRTNCHIGFGNYEVLLSCPAKNTLTNIRPTTWTRTLKWLGRNCPNLKTLDDLSGLDFLLESKKSNMTELFLDGSKNSVIPSGGLETVLRNLKRKNTLTKLEMRRFPLSLDQVRHLETMLRNHKDLQTLVLKRNSMGSIHLAEIASSLKQHMCIETLDLSGNQFDDMDSAVILRNIIHVNKSIAKLDLSDNSFGSRPEAVRCIAMGLKISARLLEINLAGCQLGDRGISVLAETLFSRDGILQRLSLARNEMSFTSLRPLVDAMIEHEIQLTDLDLSRNPIGDDGASYLAETLGNGALTHLTRLHLLGCNFGDDGLVKLVSALETNVALDELDLSFNNRFSKRGFLALANSLPAIRKLKRIHLEWCQGLNSATPSLLEGLRNNTSVVQFHTTTDDLAAALFEVTGRYINLPSDRWILETQYLGFRNRIISMIRAPLKTAPPRGLWAPALAKVSKLPDVLFSLVRTVVDALLNVTQHSS